MAQNFRGDFFERDALVTAIAQFDRLGLQPTSWETLARQRPPARGAMVGSWGSTQGDPLPEVIVVRDEDFQETLTWLNSFFSGLSPISQWCRVLSETQAGQTLKRQPGVTLGKALGAWVGAVLAECSVQAGGIQSLRDVPGSAAISSATYAAGRATAVWGIDTNLVEIARRHDELSHNLRDGTRPVSAEMLVPLWSVLTGIAQKLPVTNRAALEPLMAILSKIVEATGQIEPANLVTYLAEDARRQFDLPELAACAQGPQVERVQALDRLAGRLAPGPRSSAIDAILGLGASFVDPGSVISSELLRRFSQRFAVAPIWQGVFAGAIAPLRVMTEQGGLGRLVAKALLASDDLQGRPSSDISYEELIRWITPGRSLKLDVRGMSARSLTVELAPGVSSVFAYGRAESVSHNTVQPKAEAARSVSENSSTAMARAIQELSGLVTAVVRRVERLEEKNRQTSLLLPEPKEGVRRRSSNKKS